jgi:outer membrane protein assembly factor BamB
VTHLLASGTVASVEKLWINGSTWKEGVKRWEFTTQGAVSSFNVVSSFSPSSPTLSPDGATVFVGSHDKRLYAINAASGDLQWNFSTGGVVLSSAAVSLDGATVFVGSGDYNLYALNAASGAKRWSFATKDWVFSSPVISPDGATVFVGSTDRNLYAINAASGARKWSFDTGGYVQSSPALSPDGSTVFVLSTNTMYAIQAASGAKIWSLSVGSLPAPWFYVKGTYLLSSPTLSPDGATVFVGSPSSLDIGLHAINAVSGAKRWSFTTDGGVYSTPVLSPDGATVFVIDSGDVNKLYALNALSGAKRWSFTSDPVQGSRCHGRLPLSPDGGTVYMFSTKKLYAVDTASGAQRWNFTAEVPPLGARVYLESSTLSPDGSTIFVGSVQEADGYGKLLAIVADSLSPFHVFATTKTLEFSCSPCATCPAGQHTVQCQGQSVGTCKACAPDTFASAGTCKACAPGTFASAEGVRLKGCSTCVTCADGKLAPNCTDTSPGVCRIHWGAAKDTPVASSLAWSLALAAHVSSLFLS